MNEQDIESVADLFRERFGDPNKYDTACKESVSEQLKIEALKSDLEFEILSVQDEVNCFLAMLRGMDA